jgi:NAD(P)-dependent dehydrogenase (short-subunit alcohol dehydrogenase family)
MLLKDQVALITGTATGIGESVARLFAEHGARVYLLDRDETGNRAVADSIRAAGGWAQTFACDVRRRTEFDAVVKAAIDQVRQIDILINNAGIFPRHRFLDVTEAEWDEMQDINLKSMFHSTQLVLPHMIARRAGRIVNISSVTFHMGVAGLTPYVASKGGVIGLTRSLAREVGEHNVHVNCITPGAIKTESEARFVSDEQAREFMSRQCLPRRLGPLDVARVCLFLSSELSDGMTGQTLNVDAGWVMH